MYGETAALPISEDVATHPVSPYGVTKLAAEHLCTLYHHNYDLPTVSLRYFTVYGPRQRPDMAFHRFCRAIVSNEPLRVFDDGSQTRDFTFISDVVEANIRAAMCDAATGQVMNIAGGSRVTLRDVIRLLEEIHGASLKVVFEEKQRGDVRHTFADTGRAEQVLGYHPLVSLWQGLAREFQYIVALYQGSYAVRV